MLLNITDKHGVTVGVVEADTLEKASKLARDHVTKLVDPPAPDGTPGMKYPKTESSDLFIAFFREETDKRPILKFKFKPLDVIK
ncbi:MAG: hypothetical protein CL489_06060 [Acidobacteria bacterium]|nr:hypothetical protein [Acidobacteriota bacterium]|tara:strand:+ start:4885 stop:5136 length:252 start_codon:yes stop_codon:yes gene_type:complete